MSYPSSRYPWVPKPQPIPSIPNSSSSMPPGLRLTGNRSRSRGRGLQATCTFPAGSAIAQFPHPLVALPDAAHLRTTCDWCLRVGTSSPDSGSRTALASISAPHADIPDSTATISLKLSACARCKYVFYCSKTCQARAWKAVHKLECAALCRTRDAEFGPGKTRPPEEWGTRWFVPTPVRAAMQLLLRLRAEDERVRDAFGAAMLTGGRWDERSTGKEDGIESGALEGNVLRFREDEDRWRDLGVQALAAARYAGLEAEQARDSPEDRTGGLMLEGVRELLCKIQTNAFDRRDEDLGIAGLFLDPCLAMANHSCLPNAYVCFDGRRAILRAEREIAEGDEIEISYIDNTLSKEERHKALRLYHFECQCRRCLDDMDVYQVCQSSTLIPLNVLSLQPDFELYKNPPINRTAFNKAPALPRRGNEKDRLRGRCKPLLAAKMFAVEPLPSLLHELVIRYGTDEQNFALALCLACFLATQCHPVADVAPFKPWRVKGAMMIAQLLSQTAPLSAMGELAKTCPNPALAEKLSGMDQVSMCEAVLRLVVHYGPMAHSDDWEVAVSARELLDDIEKLEGRERETALIRAWSTDPERHDARAFIDDVVLKPINELARFAVDILVDDLFSDDSLAKKALRSS